MNNFKQRLQSYTFTTDLDDICQDLRLQLESSESVNNFIKVAQDLINTARIRSLYITFRDNFLKNTGTFHQFLDIETDWQPFITSSRGLGKQELLEKLIEALNKILSLKEAENMSRSGDEHENNGGDDKVSTSQSIEKLTLLMEKMASRLDCLEQSNSTKKNVNDRVINYKMLCDQEDNCILSSDLMVSKPNSKAIHKWLFYSVGLGFNKLATINELRYSEIEFFILNFISDYSNDISVKKYTQAYTYFLLHFASIRVLDKYSDSSMNLICQTGICKIDSILLNESELSSHRIEQIVNTASFRHAVPKSQNIQNYAAKQSFKNKPIRYCNIYNSNRTNCSSDCQYSHICKLCYINNKELKNHMPKDCKLYNKNSQI